MVTWNPFLQCRQKYFFNPFISYVAERIIFPVKLKKYFLAQKKPRSGRAGAGQKKGEREMSVDWIGHTGQVAGPVAGQVSPDQVGLVLGLFFE